MVRMQKRRQENSPNDDCLREMAKHVMYEIDGFRKGFDQWHQLSIQQESADPELNEVIEVALLHYRTLIEFFRSDPREVTVDENISTDIVATDYLAVSTAKSTPDTMDELCEAYKARIDQQLCHISTGRRQGRIWREWPTGMMKAKMEGLIRQFKKELPAERAGWFSSLTTALVEFSNEVSNGTPTFEVSSFPMPFSEKSAPRR